jgi:cytochrome c biogenesis protein CcmG, thiol:disulfide interchange protein DsbE
LSIVAKRLYMPILAALAGAALVGLLVYGVSAQSASRTLDDAVAHGQSPLAPEANRSLPLLTGNGMASLDSYRGRVVLLNFWASWCLPCQREAPLLERAQHKLERNNGTVLGVTYQDTTTDARSFVHRYGLTYPSLRDVTGEVTHSYGTQALPESFVLDRRGRVVQISRGEVSKAFLARAISLAQSS